jgi:hypothetical protein
VHITCNKSHVDCGFTLRNCVIPPFIFSAHSLKFIIYVPGLFYQVHYLSQADVYENRITQLLELCNFQHQQNLAQYHAKIDIPLL